MTAVKTWSLLLLSCFSLVHESQVFAQNTDQCSSSTFDLVLLVDSSGSIRDTNQGSFDNYNLTKEFLIGIADLMNISQSSFNGVQIAVVIFGNRGHVELDFSGDRAEIRSELANLRYLGETTNTYDGLVTTEAEVLNGTRNRPGVEDVILIITDGNPFPPLNLTIPYAHELQGRGVQMFAVGVTNGVTEENVKQLSSPFDNGARSEGISYWLLTGFGILNDVVNSIAGVICTVINRDEYCVSQPCLNGGTCADDLRNAAFVCRCRTGYFGDRCEFNHCEPQPCLNQGTCTANENDYECSCSIGYYGDRCENDYCNPDNCVNGTCVREVDRYRCECTIGYYGTDCENDYCTNNACVNGVCVGEVDGYRCDCITGYYGTYCENDYCNPDNCVYGTCVREVDRYRCECTIGYYGTNCENDYCGPPNPCLNNGTCTGLANGYECTCLDGFSGSTCENDVCGSVECLNGGWCLRRVDGFRCNCINGYGGNYCQFPPETTTEPPIIQLTPQQAEASTSSDDVNGYLIALIVVIILLVVGIIILLLLCCCWSRVFAVCCKPNDKKHVAPIVPFYTEKEITVSSAATQCDINDKHPAPLKEKKTYRQDLAVIPTCTGCGYALDSCRCCPICKRPDCCGHHCNGHHRMHHQHCDVCDPAPTSCPQCNGCPHCEQPGLEEPHHHHHQHDLNHLHHHHVHEQTECANYLGYTSSGIGSLHGGSHPATLTYHNTVVAPTRSATRKARRQRARERRENREMATSGMTSDTGSCSSRVMLVGGRRGANNTAYSSESERSTSRRSGRKDYVYIPADCPKRTQSSSQSFLNESFNAARVSAGK